jgi:hypothetical protein
MEKINMDLTKEDIVVIWEAIVSGQWSGKVLEQVVITKQKFAKIAKQLQQADMAEQEKKNGEGIPK